MKSRQPGFSYVEVMVATLLIAIMLVPALQAMQSGIQGSAIHVSLVDEHFRLADKMEQTLARSFDDLLAQADAVADPTVLIPSPYSDNAATPARRLVYLARYDGDNADSDDDPFAGTDDGLLWLRVAIENSPRALETLVLE